MSTSHHHNHAAPEAADARLVSALLEECLGNVAPPDRRLEILRRLAAQPAMKALTSADEIATPRMAARRLVRAVIAAGIVAACGLLALVLRDKPESSDALPGGGQVTQPAPSVAASREREHAEDFSPTQFRMISSSRDLVLGEVPDELRLEQGALLAESLDLPIVNETDRLEVRDGRVFLAHELDADALLNADTIHEYVDRQRQRLRPIGSDNHVNTTHPDPFSEKDIAIMLNPQNWKRIGKLSVCLLAGSALLNGTPLQAQDAGAAEREAAERRAVEERVRKNVEQKIAEQRARDEARERDARNEAEARERAAKEAADRRAQEQEEVLRKVREAVKEATNKAAGGDAGEAPRALDLAKQIFDLLDANKDGKLDENEFPMQKHDKGIDSDADGSVSPAEYSEYHRKQAEKQAEAGKSEGSSESSKGESSKSESSKSESSDSSKSSSSQSSSSHSSNSSSSGQRGSSSSNDSSASSSSSGGSSSHKPAGSSTTSGASTNESTSSESRSSESRR